MDSATREMLQKVRHRISNLQQIERLILAEFGESSNGSAPARRTNKSNPQKGATPPGPSLRKVQIHNWLKENGPAGRAEIIEGTKLPEGTVGGYLSAAKDLFENRDGKWHAR